MSTQSTYQPGERVYWFNQISLESRPVTVISHRRGRYIVETSDGHRYSPLASMVSREAVSF